MFTEAPVRNWCVQQSCTHRLFKVTSAGVRISTAFRELKLHYHCWELSRSSRSRVYECATMAKSPNGLAGSVFSSKFFSLQRCKAQMKHTLVETSKNIMRPFLLLHVLSWLLRTPIILPKEVPRSSVLPSQNLHAPRYLSEAVAMSSPRFIIVIPKPSNTKPSKPYPLGNETWLAGESQICRWFSHQNPSSGISHDFSQQQGVIVGYGQPFPARFSFFSSQEAAALRFSQSPLGMALTVLETKSWKLWVAWLAFDSFKDARSFSRHPQRCFFTNFTSWAKHPRSPVIRRVILKTSSNTN